jgi:hypothetical protein
LDATGTRMWELLTSSETIEAAYNTLSHEFEVEPEMLRTHLAELVGQLVEYGLLDLRASGIQPSDVESIPAI